MQYRRCRLMEQVHNARSADTQPLTCIRTTMRIAEFNKTQAIKSQKNPAKSVAIPLSHCLCVYYEKTPTYTAYFADRGGVRNSENSCQLSVYAVMP